MRIGIDGACWWNRRGFGRFTRELLHALITRARGHEFTVFFDRDPPPELSQGCYAAVRVPTRRPVTEAAVASGRRGLPDIAAFTRAALAHPVDTFLFPAVYSWFPLPPGRRSVVVVHDAIAEQLPDLVFPRRRARLYWAAKVRLALWQSTRVLTVSESAKRDIVQYLHVAPDRIDVTSEAADAAFRPVVDAAAIQRARASVGVPAGARLVLYVGGVAPHKNVIGLVRGFRRALARGELSDLYLVIAGDPAGAGFLSCTDELLRSSATTRRCGHGSSSPATCPTPRCRRSTRRRSRWPCRHSRRVSGFRRSKPWPAARRCFRAR